jgi:glycerol kinase
VNKNACILFLQPVISEHGLLTTVAFKMGAHTDPIYALEGSVAVAGFAAKWLMENLEVVDSYQDLTMKADTVENTNGVHFVPAFSGLYAPYWRSDARGSVSCVLLHIVLVSVEYGCLDSSMFRFKAFGERNIIRTFRIMVFRCILLIFRCRI